MLLLTYTPVHQHPFPQTRRGYPVFNKDGSYQGCAAECGHCRGYGTVYGQYTDKDGEYQTGFAVCPKCKGQMWAPFSFIVVNDGHSLGGQHA